MTIRADRDTAATASRMLAEKARQRTFRVPVIFRSFRGAFATTLAVLIIASAIFAPLIAPYEPAEQDLLAKLERPSAEHLLGTDQFGRDIFSRIIYGGRISLTIGLSAVALGLIVGILVGLTAGYFGGWYEMAMMSAVDVLLGFRTYLLAIMVVAILGTSLVNMAVAIGIAMFPEIARIIRSEVLSYKRHEFVEAARAVGATHVRIMFRHVVPQVMAPLAVVATFNIANAIVVEASLSFLGLGPSPPTPAWGLMISEGSRFILGDPWYPAIPGVAIMLTVLAFNLLGDTVRDIRDPRLRGR